MGGAALTHPTLAEDTALRKFRLGDENEVRVSFEDDFDPRARSPIPFRASASFSAKRAV